ncbi:MAG: NlpC/P60 family protein [Geobacteraceae bacterium]|nr:NlpC/P60 family protein [Geobacteraceae bacterium]
MNEPLRVLHLSGDGLWVFAETADTNGWVESRDIGYVDAALAEKWMGQAQLVIVRDFTPIHDEGGLVAERAKVGTIFPVAGERGDAYEISVAISSGRNEAREIKAQVPKGAARTLPLEFCRETVALIGNELINKPYGWGEMFQNRDCSALIRDFFLPFAIWLPRGSYNQIHSGRTISLAGLSGSEKEWLLREKGVPFLTMVYLKGHIMLYLGSMNGRPLVLHAIWGVTVRNGEGSASKQVIGKSIVSTLTPGSELRLVNGSLLERADRMLILSARCASTGRSSGSLLTRPGTLAYGGSVAPSGERALPCRPAPRVIQ